MSNDPKITQLTQDGNFRAKVQQIITTLQAKGYPDTAIIEAMRTVDEQREKVRKGYSKTMNSYHLKRGSDGKGKAADIVPRSKGWNFSKRYAMMYGWLCFTKGIGWGGLFGLGVKQKAKLKAQMAELSEEGWPMESERYQTPIGWDAAHCQADFNW